MPVRSQIAFNPKPAEEPWRASRINKTFEITPTGAEPGLVFVTRGIITPAPFRSQLEDLKVVLTTSPSRDAVSLYGTIPRPYRRRPEHRFSGWNVVHNYEIF